MKIQRVSVSVYKLKAQVTRIDRRSTNVALRMPWRSKSFLSLSAKFVQRSRNAGQKDERHCSQLCNSTELTVNTSCSRWTGQQVPINWKNTYTVSKYLENDAVNSRISQFGDFLCGVVILDVFIVDPHGTCSRVELLLFRTSQRDVVWKIVLGSRDRLVSLRVFGFITPA